MSASDLQTLNRSLLICRRCPRLVAWREQVARQKRRAYREQDYWGKPVPGFGSPQARLFIVGLAPGAHGSNRTGRMFTGDASGDFLYPALFRAGFASQPQSVSASDNLTLSDAYITAVCRCVPPGNKPTPDEIQNCQTYLRQEIEILQPKVLVALGRIAFNALLRLLNFPSAMSAFAHGAVFSLPPSSPLSQPSSLICSYHPSRQNTQTNRLTPAMFDAIWTTARQILSTDPPQGTSHARTKNPPRF